LIGGFVGRFSIAAKKRQTGALARQELANIVVCGLWRSGSGLHAQGQMCRLQHKMMVGAIPLYLRYRRRK
jgi:hypothetical protein